MTRVADLTGAELALWVARAVGMIPRGNAMGYWVVNPSKGNLFSGYIGDEAGALSPLFAPHEDWSQGGPLIEKHGIVVTNTLPWAPWHACTDHSIYVDNDWIAGSTHLIAAMRALVASVYGESVPDEVAT